jgi:hypothetical protein
MLNRVNYSSVNNIVGNVLIADSRGEGNRQLAAGMPLFQLGMTFQF